MIFFLWEVEPSLMSAAILERGVVWVLHEWTTKSAECNNVFLIAVARHNILGTLSPI